MVCGGSWLGGALLQSPFGLCSLAPHSVNFLGVANVDDAHFLEIVGSPPDADVLVHHQLVNVVRDEHDRSLVTVVFQQFLQVLDVHSSSSSHSATCSGSSRSKGIHGCGF